MKDLLSKDRKNTRILMSIFKIENTLVDYWKKQRVGTKSSAEVVSSLSGTCHPELVCGAYDR